MNHGFLHTWHLAITPLAPVHIGTGDDYEPTQYVIDGERLFSFSPETALRALPEAARADLLKILAGAPSVALIKQVQGFFYRHRERLIPEAEHVIPVLPSIAAEYAGRVGQTAQREQNGREIINQLRIARTYGDPATRRPIIPGSSLKGAIRTALLDQLNAGASLLPEERNRPSPQGNLALQQRLFHYRPNAFDHDPMRLVQLGDAADQRPAATIGTEIRYAVNRKRHPVLKDGRELAAMAENLRQVLECVPPLRPRAFLGSLTFYDPGALSSPKLPDPRLRWSFADLADACNAFYRPILNRERQELRQRGYLDGDWLTTVEQILASRQADLDANRAFLLRVGHHSGAESVTLNGVRDIKINMGKGNAPVYLPASKTVWLAARDIQERRNLLPFGWLLVEAVPEGQAFAPWPTNLLDSTAVYSANEPDWIAAMQARRDDLQTRLDEQRARDQAQREADEQTQRTAAQQAALFASLSAEGRQLATLSELLERDRRTNTKLAGGELASTLVSLLKEAQAAWPATDCAALADLADEIYRFIGWPASKKKRERQEQIQSLRGKGSS
ncbi:RAMP superfamily CRISPR-associated protein [Chromatium okenii]|jgi:CRISPR-associated protein Csm5|uniref:RAMP superfamily CRISPR-associated protein n=1 Tax=Chromatium okenii TaxID=61644 RepID=UPI0026EF3BE8|nr:RAMP superfamily CRISPR-associated protein [Chromatium okenii]MBV5310882.1 CRISPR-associated protein Csm5 [Chromatium okenii]